MDHDDVGPMVDLSMDIDAHPDTVWRILTTPEKFSTWMDATVEFEPRSGSPFRAEFTNFQTVISGSIVVLDETERHLGVTWGVESGHQQDVFPAGSSLVEFRVHESAGGCQLQVKHSRFPSAAVAREHEGGWTFHLSRMALTANRADLTTALETTLERWFTAWNEPEALPRLEALRSCCSSEVEFRDDWTVAQGVEALNEHISRCFMYMPGWRFEPTGDVRVCRGEALFGWRSLGPDGQALEGVNHATAANDGTLLRVTGFTSA